MSKRLSQVVATAGCALALIVGLGGCASGAALSQANAGITVNATGKVSTAPDLCNFSATITARAADASAAQKAAAQPTTDVIAKLKELGVDEKSIQTSYTDVSPYWDENGETDEYEARTVLEVTKVPVEQVSELMQAATDAGANQVDFMGYVTTSYDEAYQEALAKAVEAARPKAEAIAAASGARLGKVLSVTEGYQDMSLFAKSEAFATDGAAASEEAGIEVAPGEVEIEAQVTVVYAIN